MSDPATNEIPVSVCVITLNEEDHIGRCLSSTSWAAEQVVVDSGSEDRTREIAEEHGAVVVEHEWEGHVKQKQYATDMAERDWVLSLDADEWLSDELAANIRSVFQDGPPDRDTGYRMNRLSWYLDRWMYHGGWQPDWKLRLFHRNDTCWGGQDPHDHVEPTKHTESLEGYLLHDPYEDLSDHLQYLDDYTSIMADEKDRAGETGSLTQATTHAGWKFFRDYLIKLGFLDGSTGFINAYMGSFYVFMKYLKLRQRQTPDSPSRPPDQPGGE